MRRLSVNSYPLIMMMRLAWLVLIIIALSACQPALVAKSGRQAAAQPSRSVAGKCFTQTAHGANRMFLLAVGVNTGKLKHANQDAVRFARAMQKRFKIPTGRVCVLKNAYRRDFVRALKTLRQRVTAKDSAVIYFSGHGSYIADKDGDDGDGWDETLVTYDANDRKKPCAQAVLKDDDFVALVNALPTGKVLTVMDACFSAGMYLDPAEGALADAVPKFMVKGCLGKILPVGKQRRGPRLKGALLSAAGEKEQAWEIPGQGGAFTTRWIKNLQAKPQAGLKTVFERTRRDVIKRTGKRQHPQARGHAAGLFE